MPLLAARVTEATRIQEVAFEIVVVDDGSTDQTLDRLVEWQEDEDRLIIVQLSRNWGHQNAYNAGLDIAKGDAVIFMDGDLEDPPELIEELVNQWFKGNEVVYTVKEYREQPLIRRLLTWSYYRTMQLTSKHPVEVQAGMYSLVDSKVARELREMRERGKSYPNLRALVGFKQMAIPYTRPGRARGRPKQTLRKLFNDGLNAMFANTYLPIRIFSLFGLKFFKTSFNIKIQLLRVSFDLKTISL